MLKLEPGRELDALVATKVMGWKKALGSWVGGVVPLQTEDGYVFQSEFCPSVNIEDAWEVVEKVCEGGRRVEISTEGRDTTVSLLWAQKETGEIGLLFGVRGRTVPHAICLAALKAVGYKDNEV